MTARAQPYSPASYEAFRLDNGKASRLQIGEPASLTAAIDAAKLSCLHKEVLAIRESDDGGARVHLFAIRRKSPQWIQPPGEIVPRRVAEMYADLVAVVPGEVICG